ncbi:hypothetical protein PQR71_41525 [Paraburkholderia fungorum]
MTAMSLRKSLRQYGSHLNRAQRRKWLEQRMRLTPRVNVSGAYVPPCVARQYVQMGSIRGAA